MLLLRYAAHGFDAADYIDYAATHAILLPLRLNIDAFVY